MSAYISRGYGRRMNKDHVPSDLTEEEPTSPAPESTEPGAVIELDRARSMKPIHIASQAPEAH